MNTSRTTPRSLFVIAGLVVTIALLFGSLMLATAQDYDGRINLIEHAGGSAVYCVDEHFIAATRWQEGGIRVLSGAGQEQLFAPAADIISAGDPPETTVQVGAGANAFGPLTLYYRPDSKFQLMGTDEWGKAFEFVWSSCGTFAPPQSSVPATPPIFAPTPTTRPV